MDFKLNILILLITIQISNSLTPIYNFLNSAQDLLKTKSTYSYTLFHNIWDKNQIFLTKRITKTGGSIIEKNYIKINNETEMETNWENIESFYSFDGIIYICPSGKNYLTKYYNGSFIPLIPKDNIVNDWDLKCFYQSNGHWIFTFHLNLNHPGKLFGYKIEKNEFKNLESIKNGIFDFIWNNYPLNINYYNLIGLLMDGPYISLHLIQVKIEENNINGIEGPLIKLDKKLDYLRANFSGDNYLYWFSYNKSNLISGFSNEHIYYMDNLSNLTFKLNHFLPFEFFGDYEIKNVNFVKRTQFIYYEIDEWIKQDKITHFGIIDIRKNLVLFDTIEKIKDIKYHSSNSLLIITDNSAYKLCIFAKDKYNNCIDKCPLNTYLILDTEKFNYCGNQKENYCNNYIIKPNNVCVKSCNNNLFYIENQNCILCKDLNINKPYKVYNENICLENKPENTFILNEKLKILKFCDNSCKTCLEEKKNECLSCKEGYNLEEGKCIYLNNEDNNIYQSYSSSFSIIKIPEKPLFDETIKTKLGEIKYIIKEKDNNNTHFFNYCFEGLKNLNLIHGINLDYKKYDDNKICFENFIKDDIDKYSNDICELFYETKYIDKKIYSSSKSSRNRFFGGTPKNLIQNYNKFTFNHKKDKISEIKIIFNDGNNFIINVKDEESLFTINENFNYMFCLPKKIYDIFENYIFSYNHNKKAFCGLNKLNEEEKNLFPNIISFKIGNKIFTLSKDFLFNKLNLEFNFINNYECDNFIFGFHFLKLFDFREFNLESEEVNLYLDKNNNLMIEEEEKKEILISKLNIIIIFSFIILFIIIALIKKNHKKKKIEYYNYYFDI